MPDLPPLPDDTPPATLVLGELTDEERALVRDAVADGRRMVGTDEPVPAIRRWAHGGGDEDGEIPLGALWGQCVVEAVEWRWCVVFLDGANEDERYLAVASADGAHAALPIAFIREQRGRTDNTIELLFNMIVAGKLSPPAKKVQILR